MSKKILVIEDDESMLAFMKKLVEGLGHEYIFANDGLKGLELARNEYPDLIILDIMLPRLDGFKVSRYLKFDEMHQHIPILMLTAKSDAKDEKIGEATGANAYITKPFEKQNLVDTINRLLA